MSALRDENFLLRRISRIDLSHILGRGRPIVSLRCWLGQFFLSFGNFPIRAEIVDTFRLCGLIPRSSGRSGRNNSIDIILFAQDQNAWDWLKNRNSDSEAMGLAYPEITCELPRVILEE